MQEHKQVGISFPKDILSKIDVERGDISRSRYILRQLEKVLQQIVKDPLLGYYLVSSPLLDTNNTKVITNNLVEKFGLLVM